MGVCHPTNRLLPNGLADRPNLPPACPLPSRLPAWTPSPPACPALALAPAGMSALALLNLGSALTRIFPAPSPSQWAQLAASDPTDPATLRLLIAYSLGPVGSAGGTLAALVLWGNGLWWLVVSPPGCAKEGGREGGWLCGAQGLQSGGGWQVCRWRRLGEQGAGCCAAGGAGRSGCCACPDHTDISTSPSREPAGMHPCSLAALADGAPALPGPCAPVHPCHQPAGVAALALPIRLASCP